MRTDLPTSSILQCAAGVWCWPNTFAQWELGISGDVFLFDLPGLCDTSPVNKTFPRAH